jgi:hypothetical protein
MFKYLLPSKFSCYINEKLFKLKNITYFVLYHFPALYPTIKKNLVVGYTAEDSFALWDTREEKLF